MRTEHIIGIKFGGDLNQFYRDENGLRKPFFFHLPYSPKLRGNYVDFKALGSIYYLCNAIAGKDADPILLYCITSDHKEDLEGWIELEEVQQGYEVHNLSDYKGEEGTNPFLNLPWVYNVSKNPKYIYLKKI